MCIEKLKWSLTSQCKGSGNGYGDKCGKGIRGCRPQLVCLGSTQRKMSKKLIENILISVLYENL